MKTESILNSIFYYDELEDFKKNLKSKGNIHLRYGECLQELKRLEDNSVDCIITDPPYGTTACKWDSVIPLEPMWEQLNRVIKTNGAIVLFGGEPFTSILINSNLKGFKYRWDWNKKIPSGMGYAKYRPMQQTEDICIFTENGEKTFYNPQMILRDKPIKSGGNNIPAGAYSGFKDIGKKEYKKTYTHKNPVTLIEFDKVRRGALHPTQKPVELIEYLIKTYTDEEQIVLDFTMGSGTTGVACKNLNRKFYGIELEEKYYDIACERLKIK